MWQKCDRGAAGVSGVWAQAGRAALGLSCVACFERSVGVFADRGASKIMMFQESLAFDLIKCSYIKTLFYVGTVMLLSLI